jgi:hypothetical protein
MPLLRCRLGAAIVAVTLPAQGESVNTSLASSGVQSAICLSFHGASAAPHKTAAAKSTQIRRLLDIPGLPLCLLTRRPVRPFHVLCEPTGWIRRFPNHAGLPTFSNLVIFGTLRADSPMQRTTVAGLQIRRLCEIGRSRHSASGRHVTRPGPHRLHANYVKSAEEFLNSGDYSDKVIPAGACRAVNVEFF